MYTCEVLKLRFFLMSWKLHLARSWSKNTNIAAIWLFCWPLVEELEWNSTAVWASTSRGAV
jgi:hypothetical protein